MVNKSMGTKARSGVMMTLCLDGGLGSTARSLCQNPANGALKICANRIMPFYL